MLRSLLVCMVVFLAGCTDPAAQEPTDTDSLLATDDTGVLRGVVVDEAIQPVAQAQVTVTHNSQLVTTLTTDEAGLFAMAGLDPGLYVLATAPTGFFSVDKQTTVVAGVSEPDVVKLIVQRDLQTSQFAIQVVWNGHMVCAATGGNYCALPELYVGINPFDDNSLRLYYDEFVSVGRQPTFVQAEVVWETTQAATPTLRTRWTATNPEMRAIGSWNYTYGDGGGESPIIVSIDETMIKESRLGIDMGLSVEMFADTPGVVLDQPFTIFLTNFYGYAPPEGWRFVDDSSVPPP